jgi:hypothetical protein
MKLIFITVPLCNTSKRVARRPSFELIPQPHKGTIQDALHRIHSEMPRKRFGSLRPDTKPWRTATSPMYVSLNRPRVAYGKRYLPSRKKAPDGTQTPMGTEALPAGATGSSAAVTAAWVPGGVRQRSPAKSQYDSLPQLQGERVLQVSASSVTQWARAEIGR